MFGEFMYAVLTYAIKYWPISLALLACLIMSSALPPGNLKEVIFIIVLASSVVYYRLVVHKDKPKQQEQQGQQQRKQQVPVEQGNKPINQQQPKQPEKQQRTVEEIWADINSMIGLESVKKTLGDIQNTIQANYIRQQKGMNISTGTLHMVFRGNPGTGKTEIARKTGELLCALGALPGNAFVEATRSDLIGEYVGQTAPKVVAKVNEVLKQGGGILFIDEAYGLANAGGSTADFGKEAVEVLIQAMENCRDRLCVIMAGYEKEMDDFVYESNPGLKSRIAFYVDFPDYTTDELIQILQLHAKRKGCVIEVDALEKVRAFLPTVNLKVEGNGRYIRNLLEKTLQKQSARILRGEDPAKLIADDFPIPDRRKFAFGETVDNIWVEINSMIGLQEVKDTLRELQATVEANIIKRKQGMNVSTGMLHMVFKGSPGTGKTEIARKAGELLCAIGALPGDAFVEANQADLIAGHVGQTAIKTNDKVEEVLRQGGGILFIDEAYGLSNSQFGDDSINTLITAMENNRDRLCVVMAGYEKEMNDFVNKTNPGLKSRIAFQINFPDYSTEELVQILQLHGKKKGYTIEPQAINKIRNHLTNIKIEGNGRYIRNLLEKAERRQSHRVVAGQDPVLLTADDFDI